MSDILNAINFGKFPDEVMEVINRLTTLPEFGMHERLRTIRGLVAMAVNAEEQAKAAREMVRIECRILLQESTKHWTEAEIEKATGYSSMSTLDKMSAYAREMQEKLDIGVSMKDLAQWSYQERQRGRDVPYMAIHSTDKNGPTVLWASPLKKQRALDAFFSEKANGSSAMLRYRLTVENGKVRFIEKSFGVCYDLLHHRQVTTV